MLISDDEGASWRAAAPSWRKMDEAQMAQLPNGSVLLMMRHRAEARRGKAVAISNDGGESWGDLGFEPQLKSPVCQASLVSIPPRPIAPSLRTAFAPRGTAVAADAAGAAGEAAAAAAAGVLFYSGPSSASAREALVVRRSVDGGATWGATRLIDPGPSGYSCLVAPLPLAIGCDEHEASGGACGGVLYEADNLVIRFARFPLVF